MSPRRLRRLTAAAVVVVLIGVILAAVSSMRPSTDPGQASKEVFGTFGAFGISDGMRSGRVVARLGVPDQRRNGCWIYRIHGGTFAGIKLLPQIAGIDAVRYCFYVGVVSNIEDHWRKVNGANPFPQPWVAPVTFGCGGQPCQPSQ